MKKQILSLFFLWSIVISVIGNNTIHINGKEYIKTVLSERKQIVPGVYSHSYSLPDYPLQVFFVEADLTRSELQFEACLSHDSIRGIEPVLEMCTRKSTSDKHVVAAINADFFRNIKEQDPAGKEYSVYQSCNGTMSGGIMGEVPSPSFGPMLGFCSSGVPYLGQMGYNGYVKRKYRKETLHNINTARGADKLILYTPLIGKTTRTNGYGTEVVLMMKDGFEWSTNKEMTCIVRKINRKSGNTAVLPDELVLSGHGVSEEFLNTFQPGEEIKIRINISIEGHSGVAPDFREMLGSNTLVLENGEPVAVTSTAGDPKGRHPRTLAGYSADKTKFYMCVIDGRTAVSAGISQADAAAIMKDAGAYTAINFDGGGSSILAVEGVPFNNPAGGKPYRLVSDALLLVQHQDVSSARPVQSIQPSIQIVKQNLEKRFRITGVEEGAIKQVNIYSLTGNCLLTLDSTAWFDLSNYPGGVYLVEVILKNNVKYIRKIPC